MGDEKETWKVKTLDEILQEKKRRRELEEKSDPKRSKNTDDRESKRDTPEEGELRDHRMEITIRNSPYTREDSTEDRGEEDESLAIKPPQQMTRKDKSYHRKEEKRKDKRRRRSLSAEGAGKHMRTKDKEKEREDERRKRQWQEDNNSRRDYERQKRRDQQQERQRERERKLREQQQKEQREQRELKERERRAEERRKERDTRRDGPGSHHRGAPGEEYADKSRSRHRSRSPVRQQRETKAESSEQRRAVREGKMEEKNPLSDLQDISDSERKTSTPESSMGTPLSRSLSLLSVCVCVCERKRDVRRMLKKSPAVRVRQRKRASQDQTLRGPNTAKVSKHTRALREINTILKAQHPNIVTVREIVVGSNMDKIYIVMNYVEHDLKSLMETMKQPFLPGEVKTLMIQLLRGVRHLHDNWILHRDLKTSNLLLSHKGILKIGDFGLAREYGSPLKPYTPVVVTLWYRSPDLLLGAKEYSTAVDMWSVGCIFGELLTQKPLFPGKSEIDQINKVFKKIWPGYSELPAVKKMTFTEYPYNNLRKRFGALLSDQGFDLMNKFLTYCPAKRISADEALKQEYFRESPLPIEPSMFPTWPAKSEQQRVKRGTSPRPPEGGQDFSQLGDDDLKDTGFHLTTANQGASKAGPGFSLKF
uniref:Cyclin-dependent kinase 11B n=1 Tax=Sinocyclocheilus rhinocerous TaxID=307959 RepID=A0A673G9L8_9TELE